MNILSAKLLLLAIAIFSTTLLNAQDKSTIALSLFKKAETAYTQGEFETAIDNLDQAEQTLGSTTANILYIKIKTLDTLEKYDAKYRLPLQKSVDAFFKMADKKTYSKSKYTEVEDISLFLQQMSQEEEEKYNNLASSNNIYDYDDFFMKFPDSKHNAEIKSSPNYLKLSQKSAQPAPSAQTGQSASSLSQSSKEWLAVNGPLWNTYRKKIALSPTYIKKTVDIEKEAEKRGIPKTELTKFKQ